LFFVSNFIANQIITNDDDVIHRKYFGNEKGGVDYFVCGITHEKKGVITNKQRKSMCKKVLHK